MERWVRRRASVDLAPAWVASARGVASGGGGAGDDDEDAAGRGSLDGRGGYDEGFLSSMALGSVLLLPCFEAAGRGFQALEEIIQASGFLLSFSTPGRGEQPSRHPGPEVEATWKEEPG